MADAHLLIAGGVIRRGDEVLLVQQQGPDDPGPAWSWPGGVVEPGESLVDAMAREVREETGLTVRECGPLLYVTQQTGPIGGSVAFLFDVVAWEGEVSCEDPDTLVSDACFWSIPEAVALLRTQWLRIMSEPAVAYLTGQTPLGTTWHYRRTERGDELVKPTVRFPGSPPGGRPSSAR